MSTKAAVSVAAFLTGEDLEADQHQKSGDETETQADKVRQAVETLERAIHLESANKPVSDD